MARIRSDYVFGTTSTEMTASTTTLSSAGLSRLPVVTSPDVAAITLHDGTNFEIVHVTAHTASATTATISRAQEGTTARAWGSGTKWLNPLTKVDVDGFTVGGGGASLTSAVLGTTYAVTSTMTNTGLSLTLPAAGNYLVTASLDYEVASGDTFASARLAKNGTTTGATLWAKGSGTNTPRANVAQQWHLTGAAAGDVLTIQAQRTGTGTTNVHASHSTLTAHRVA